MRRSLASALLLALCAFLSPPLWAQPLENLAILGGPEGGTYNSIAGDISGLLNARCGKQIKIVPTKGSQDSLKRLRFQQSVQLALVQSDSLFWAEILQDSDPQMREQVRRFRYVAPLYQEEVHIVTRRDAGIRTLKDLAGKRVSIGEDLSGTIITAQLILDAAGVKVEPVMLDSATALERLLGPASPTERIDAFFFVAGKPAKLLSEGSRLSELALVPIDIPQSLNQVYKPASVTFDDYRWLREPVDTVAVTAVLMTFDFRGANCADVAVISKLIRENLDELQRTGHEKWREVDVAQPLPGWQKSQCVSEREALPILRSSDKTCLLDERCLKFAEGTPQRQLCNRVQK
jgi:TRAP transporter TAXI family solute receptor